MSGHRYIRDDVKRYAVDGVARRVTTPGPVWQKRKDRPVFADTTNRVDHEESKSYQRHKEAWERAVRELRDPKTKPNRRERCKSLERRRRRRMLRERANWGTVDALEPKPYKDRGSDITVVKNYVSRMNGEQRTTWRRLTKNVKGSKLAVSCRAAIARLVLGYRWRPMDEALLRYAERTFWT